MGLLSLVLGLVGAGGIGWLSHNVLGTSQWLENTFNPEIEASKNIITNSNFSSYNAGFYAFRSQVMAPTDKDMKALDDFFEAYGYNVSLFEVPNLKVRSNFTYVKTKDAVVKSSNVNAARQMAAMLNDGCKFWVGEIG